MSEEENLRRQIEQERTLIGNMTIGQLIQDMAQQFVQIVNEILSLELELSFEMPLRVIAVFTKQNRLVYLGIVFMIAGAFSMFARR